MGTAAENAVAGLVIDAQNGDFEGRDYFTLYQYDNGVVELRNLANTDMIFETNNKKVRIASSGDIYVETPGQGVILTASNGSCYKLIVDNNGTLSTQAVSPCPQ